MELPDSRMLAVFAGTFAIAYVVWKFVRGPRSDGSRRPPCIQSLPLVGSMLFLPHYSVWPKEFLKTSAKIGNVFAFYMGSQYAVVLNGKETIHEAFIKRSPSFSDRPYLYPNETVFNIHAKGIVDHHYDAELRQQRKLSLSILKEFGFGKDIMEERIKSEVSVLLQKIRDVESVAFSPDTAVMSCVLNVIVSILFGRRMDDKALSELSRVSHSLMHSAAGIYPIAFFPLLRFLPKFRCNLVISTRFNHQLFHILRSGIETADEDSFVTHYADRNGFNLDREQLEYVVRDFVMAGMDTVTATLLWSLVLLAGHDGQCVQERLSKEIDSQVPREHLPSLADRPHMPFVEATILEIMRIRTVVPLGVMNWVYCDTTVGGHFIPSNTLVIPNLYSVHMDPNVWEEPEQFRPERFLDEFGKVVGKELIMPFSIGRRSCLGELLAQQEIFLFLTAIVQNFIIKPPDGCEEIVCSEEFSITSLPSRFTVRFLARPDPDD